MLAMRRAGLFDHEGRSSGARIPKRIVQFWDKRAPEDLVELMRSWRVQHPQYEYFLFNDVTATTFLQNNASSRALEAFRRTMHPAQRADIFRLAYLAQEGGFYVDADDRCLGNIGLLYPEDISLAIYQENYGTVANNFVGASRGHPVILRPLDLATEAMLRGDSDIVWLSTGPGLLTRAFAQVVVESSSSLLASTSFRELGETQRVIGIHCPAQYKKTDQHWSRAAFSQ